MKLTLDFYRNANCLNLDFDFFRAFYINVGAGRGVLDHCPTNPEEPSNGDPGIYKLYMGRGTSSYNESQSTAGCCNNQYMKYGARKFNSLCSRFTTLSTVDRVDDYGNYQTKLTLTESHSSSSTSTPFPGCVVSSPPCDTYLTYDIKIEMDSEFPEQNVNEVTCNISPPCNPRPGAPPPPPPDCRAFTWGGPPGGCTNTVKDRVCDTIIYGDSHNSSNSRKYVEKCPRVGCCYGTDVEYEETESYAQNSNGQENWLNKSSLDQELVFAFDSVRKKLEIYKNNLPQNKQKAKCGNGLPADCWSPAFSVIPFPPFRMIEKAQFRLEYKYNRVYRPLAGYANTLSVIPVVSTSIAENAEWKKFKNINGTFFIYKISPSGKTPCDCGENPVEEFLADSGKILNSTDFSFDPGSLEIAEDDGAALAGDFFDKGWKVLGEPLDVKNDSYLGTNCDDPQDLFCNPYPPPTIPPFLGTSVIPKDFTWCHRIKDVTLEVK